MATLAYGAIGFADDYLKIKRRHNLGSDRQRKARCHSSRGDSLRVRAQIFDDLQHRLSLPFIKTFTPEIYVADISAGVCADRARRFFKRGEPNRWAGRAGDLCNHGDRGGAHRFHLCDRS